MSPERETSSFLADHQRGLDIKSVTQTRKKNFSSCLKGCFTKFRLLKRVLLPESDDLSRRLLIPKVTGVVTFGCLQYSPLEIVLKKLVYRLKQKMANLCDVNYNKVIEFA